MIDCRNYALRLITHKDRTEKEMREKLRQKGYDENIIEDELAFLKDYGYINDEEYARRFINDAQNLKKWGKIRIARELLRRGIEREIADIAIENAFVEDGGERVKEQLEIRFKDSDFSNIKERTRIFNYFLRRGYTAEEIRGAMNSVCSFNDIITD